MSDISDSTAAAETQEAAPTSEAPSSFGEALERASASSPEAEPEATNEAAATEPSTETPAEPEGSKATDPEVRKLRDEAARYRTNYKPFRDAFEGYDEESRDAFLEIARNIVEAPEDAAKRMIEVSRGLLGDKFEDMLQDKGPKPLTEEDFEKKIQERESRQQQENELKQVISKAESLGYEENSPEFADLMFRAFNNHEGDLEKAHEEKEQQKQKIIDDYLASKAEDSDKFPPVVGTSTQAAGDRKEPKSFDEASAAAMAFLKSRPGE